MFCRFCGLRARKDNMARHCKDAHGLETLYLRKKDGAPEQPYSVKWKKYLLFPGKILVRVPEHHQEPEEVVKDSGVSTKAPERDRPAQQHVDEANDIEASQGKVHPAEDAHESHSSISNGGFKKQKRCEEELSEK